jgi:ABC-type sugar transport system ATPase subunit
VRFGATTALAGVDLDLQPGEVHAVVGENGAGKSTLLKVVAGVVRPQAGTIALRDHARVAWVPQEPDLPPDLTVEEVIFLGAELRGWGGWLRRRAMRDAARQLLATVGCLIDPGRRVRTLSAPQRKQVQLAHALRHDPELLLLDEPTAVLGRHETAQLFAILARRKASGHATLYVSHRLEEVLEVADRVTVLRDGGRVSTDAVSAVSLAALVTRMVGRAVSPSARPPAAAVDEALRLTNVSAGMARGVSLTVRRGEIVGLAGLIGAGRSDVLEAVAGLQPVGGGHIACSETPVLLPEDRGRNGLVPTLTLRENLFLPAGGWRLDRVRERRDTIEWIERLRIRARGTDTPVAALSGGNQQKLLFARTLRRQPRLLLLDEPTAGVDVGTKLEIHSEIARLAASGVAILLASSDLLELLHLCDRIVAMREGRVVGEVTAAHASEERVAGLIMMEEGAGCRVSGVG